MAMLSVMRAAGISAQFGIAPHLMLGQKRRGQKMIFEVGRAKLGLQLTDFSDSRFQALGGYGPIGEQAIEIRFPPEEPLTDRD